MSEEHCKLCGKMATPWKFIENLNGHICNDCENVSGDLRYKSFNILFNRINQLEETVRVLKSNLAMQSMTGHPINERFLGMANVNPLAGYIGDKK